MRLTLERFGGLAGVAAKPLVVDTGVLPSPVAKRIESLAEGVRDESSEGASHPDGFGYELTIETELSRRVIGFEIAGASDGLKQLVAEMRGAMAR